MSARANYFKIGLFVISGMAIAVIAITVLGAGALFRKTVPVETYFEESVQGLDVGSPVKFRGVRIGKVERITIVSKEYPSDSRYILVRMALYPEACPVRTEELVKLGLTKEIEKGLRVRLTFVGLTGAAYPEVDYLDPERNPPLRIDWQPRYPYIPSAPSTITRLSESLDRIMRTLDQINIPRIAESVETTLQLLTKASEDFNLKKTGEEARQLLSEIRETNRRISQALADNKLNSILSDTSVTVASARRIVEGSEKPLSQFKSALTEASTSIHDLASKLDVLSRGVPENLTQLQRTLRRLDKLISRQQQDIEVTLENIRIISENLKELTENAKQYPSQLLFGEPPSRSEPGIAR